VIAMSQTLFDEILRLDAPFARYYQYRLKRSRSGKLTKEDAKELFEGGLMDGNAITANEVKALQLLIVRDQFDRPALRYLNKKAEEHETGMALINGGVAKALQGGELAEFHLALSMASNVKFTNPTTMASYNPCMYFVIKDLVRQDKIRVYQFPRGNVYGVYYSNSNSLILYADADRNERTDTIVHETTHAIQDWRDQNMDADQAEADAYIAGAVAYRKVNGSPRPKKDDDTMSVAYHVAAPLVLAGKANNARDTAWKEAHQKVVDTIMEFHTSRFKERKGPSEKDELIKTWKAIRRATC